MANHRAIHVHAFRGARELAGQIVGGFPVVAVFGAAHCIAPLAHQVTHAALAVDAHVVVHIEIPIAQRFHRFAHRLIHGFTYVREIDAETGDVDVDLTHVEMTTGCVDVDWRNVYLHEFVVDHDARQVHGDGRDRDVDRWNVDLDS